MAWTPTTSFETTDGSTAPTDENTVTSTTDGSGWSGAWAEYNAVTGKFLFDDDVASIPSGSWAMKVNITGSGQEPGQSRSFSGITSGRLSLYYRTTNTTYDDHRPIQLTSGASRPMDIDCLRNASGNRHFSANGSTVTSALFATNTWYKIDVDFDCTTDTFDLYVDDTKKNVTALNFAVAVTSIDKLSIRNNANSGGAHQWWIDDIKPYAAAAPANDVPPPQIITWGFLATVLHAGTFLLNFFSRPFTAKPIHNS